MPNQITQETARELLEAARKVYSSFTKRGEVVSKEQGFSLCDLHEAIEKMGEIENA